MEEILANFIDSKRTKPWESLGFWFQSKQIPQGFAPPFLIPNLASSLLIKMYAAEKILSSFYQTALMGRPFD